MDRRPQRERDEPNNDGLDWLWKGIAAVGVGAAAAVAIGAAYNASREEDKNKQGSSYSSEQGPQLQPSTFRHEYSHSSAVEEEPSLTITVDATPSRGGGIIRFANDETVYFYSVDWTNIFRFPQEADKFEMVNALVALKIVKQYFSPQYERILLQTDNNFALKNNGFESVKLHNQLYLQVNNAINTLLFDPAESNKEISQVFKDSCPDMKLADNLSRNNMDAFSENVENSDDFNWQGISTKANLVLPYVKPNVPTQFWK